jgi:hypothetical protein
MTIAQSSRPHGGSPARIRILGDPAEPVHRHSRVPLIVACCVAAAIGIAAAWALRTVVAGDAPGVASGPQQARGVAVSPTTHAASGAQAFVGVQARGTEPGKLRTDSRALQRLIVDASTAALPAAARHAARTSASQTTAKPESTSGTVPQPAVPVAPSSSAPAPGPAPAPASVRQPPAEQAAAPAPAAPKPIGPEQPPNPVNPNSQIGSP